MSQNIPPQNDPKSDNHRNSPRPQKSESSSKYPGQSSYPPRKPYQSNNTRDRSRDNNRGDRERSRDKGRQNYHDSRYKPRGGQRDYDQGGRRGGNGPFHNKRSSGYNNNRDRDRDNRDNNRGGNERSPYDSKNNKDRDRNRDRDRERKYSSDNFDSRNNNENRSEYYRNDRNDDSSGNKEEILIFLPDNVFKYFQENLDRIKNKLQAELKEDNPIIQIDYKIPEIQENILRFVTSFPENKSYGIKTIAEFFNEEIKKNNEISGQNIKISFLIPKNVIGFVIGSKGKNINEIRDTIPVKIDVQGIKETEDYTRIDISGNTGLIASAADKVYGKIEKYYKNNKFGRDRDGSHDNRDNRERNNNRMDRDNRDSNRDDNRDGNRDGNRDNGNGRDYGNRYNNRNDKDDRRRGNGGNFRGGRADRGRFRKPFEKDNRDNRDRDRDYNQRENRSNSRGNHSFHEENMNESKHDENMAENIEKDLPKENVNENEDKPKENEENINQVEDKVIEEKNEQENEKPVPMQEENPDKENIIENNENKNLTEEKKDQEPSDNKENIQKDESIKPEINVNDIINEDEENEEKANYLTNPDKGKTKNIVIYLTNEEIEHLNGFKDNVWINLENLFHCSISKTTKNIEGKEISLITFTGTPKQNCQALFQLQQYFNPIIKKNIETTETKK